jgi:hypothetical protein
MEGILYELAWFWMWITEPLRDIGVYELFDQIIIFIVLIMIIRYFIKRRTPYLQANWNMLLDEFSFSTPEFYTLLSEKVKGHEISGLTINQVSLKESHSFSSKRRYVRFRWREYSYDCCMAPFGNGTFVSWWFYSKRSVGELMVASLPFIGKWLTSKFFRQTYYTYDTASMFRTYMEESFHSVIDDITKDTGVRISQEDRKPNVKEIFKR